MSMYKNPYCTEPVSFRQTWKESRRIHLEPRASQSLRTQSGPDEKIIVVDIGGNWMILPSFSGRGRHCRFRRVSTVYLAPPLSANKVVDLLTDLRSTWTFFGVEEVQS